MNISVLLSGGVDSSVVVHLLCEQGYRPSLFYIKIGMEGTDYMDCSAEEDWEMATAVAHRYAFGNGRFAERILGTGCCLCH
jgi:tRNA-specific 2-thiouridylase